MKAKLNRAWHARHRLGRKASLDERLAWHAEHARVCGCRAMPASIAAALKARTRRRAKSAAAKR